MYKNSEENQLLAINCFHKRWCEIWPIWYDLCMGLISTGRLSERELENINNHVTDLLKLHHKMVYSPPVKDESTFKFPEMVKFHLLYAEHVINFGKEYEVIGSSSHKTFNELKRRYACIRGKRGRLF